MRYVFTYQNGEGVRLFADPNILPGDVRSGHIRRVKEEPGRMLKVGESAKLGWLPIKEA